MVSPPGRYVPRLRESGFRCLTVPMERRSLNLFREIKLLSHLVGLYRREMPCLTHHFTIKCVVYGSLAAWLAGVKARVNAVTGLGHVFTDGGYRTRLLRRIVRHLLRLTLAGTTSRLILQNSDDRSAFLAAGLIKVDKIRLIQGSGVNTERFTPRETAKVDEGGFRVLLATRLLWDKGIGEYIEAGKILKERGFAAEFMLAGSPDAGNPAAVPDEQIAAWEREGAVKVLGHVDDMASLLRQADLVVLPSFYREGIPRSLLEAAACGLPIVTTDTPGCREVVEHGVNGLLVPCKDAAALAGAIQCLYEHPQERKRMGAVGRAKVLAEFDERIVLKKTLDVYRELIAMPGGSGKQGD